jgi:enoyl-CoA hydratase/carnithine racemase
MKFGDVLYQSRDRVAFITLNRPERYNAISESMPGDIADAFAHEEVGFKQAVVERDSADPIAGSKN